MDFFGFGKKKEKVKLENLSEEEKHALRVLFHSKAISNEFSGRWHRKNLARESAYSVARKYLEGHTELWALDGAYDDIPHHKAQELVPKYEDTLKRLYALGLVKSSPGGEYIITKNGEQTARQLGEQEQEGGLVPKVTASIFLFSGIGFMFASDFSSTGNVVAEGSQFATKNISAFLSVLLAAIGGFLFVKRR